MPDQPDTTPPPERASAPASEPAGSESAVGVAISVTTIPASALFGVLLGLGDVSGSWGAAGVLGGQRQPCCCSPGTATLAVQRWLISRGSAGAERERLAQETTCTTTVRSRGRSSKSINTSCCQVPRASRPSHQRDLVGGPDQRGALVSVGIRVVIEAVVLVVALDRDEAVDQVPQVGDAAGLELHRRDCGGGPTHEGGDQSIRHGSCGHDPLDVGGDVNDVGVPLRRVAQLPAVDGHALTLANEDRFSPESGDAASRIHERLRR